MKKRKIPMRQCVACREKKEKHSLFRVVRTPDGEIKIDADPRGKLPGRGAYLCRNIECFELARKKNVLNRTFDITIDEDTYEEIRKGIIALSNG